MLQPSQIPAFSCTLACLRVIIPPPVSVRSTTVAQTSTSVPSRNKALTDAPAELPSRAFLDVISPQTPAMSSKQLDVAHMLKFLVSEKT